MKRYVNTAELTENWSTRVEVPKYPVKAGVYSFALHIFFVNACMHLLHFEGKMLSAVPRLKYYVNIESIRRPWARLWLVVGTKKTKKKKQQESHTWKHFSDITVQTI